MDFLHKIVGLMLLTSWLQSQEQDESLHRPPAHPQVQITINAPTNSSLQQENLTNQENSMDIKQSDPTLDEDEYLEFRRRYRQLPPDESAIKGTARNFCKIGLIACVCYACPPAGAAYLVNRCIIQPLCDNGDMFETVTDEQRREYAQNNMRKVPQARFFPLLESLQKKYEQYRQDQAACDDEQQHDEEEFVTASTL